MSVPAPAETALTNVDPIDTEVGRAEAELAARLMTGQLLPAEYREAMAHLAASDTVSRPIVVPPGRSP